MTTNVRTRPSPRDEDPARRSWQLVLDPVFGPYFFGRILSTGGVWIFNIVAAVTAWDLSRSTTVVGAVSIALFVPQLLFAPLSGARADRGRPKPQLITGRLLIATSAGSLAIGIATVGVQGLPGAWVLVVSASVVGMGFVVGGPVQHSLLPSLVRPSELAQAVALNTLPPTIARAGGPVIGALLLVTTGPAAAFAVTAAANLTYATVILCLPLDGRVKRARRHEGSVRAGFAYLRTDPTVAFLLVGMLAVGLGADPVVTLTPALSASFGHGEALVGVFASAFGVGAALGYFGVRPLRERFGIRRLAATGLTCLSLGTLASGIAPAVPAAVAGMGLAGLGFCWAMTGTTTQVYERIPETLRGRVMAFWSMAFTGSRPFGAALSGVIADSTSVTLAFVATAAIVGTFSLTATLGSLARH